MLPYIFRCILLFKQYKIVHNNITHYFNNIVIYLIILCGHKNKFKRRKTNVYDYNINLKYIIKKRIS